MLKRKAEGDPEVFIIIDVRDDDCIGGHIPGRFVSKGRRQMNVHPFPSHFLHLNDALRYANTRGTLFSVNHPAFVFTQEIDKMVEKYKRTPKIIFHCRHSQIRGPQCATAFSTRLKELYPEEFHLTRVFLLQDGFEGWICRYGAQNPLLVADFHASVWRDALDGLSPLRRMLYTRFDPRDEQ